MSLKTDPQENDASTSGAPKSSGEWPGLGNLVRDGVTFSRTSLRETAERLVVDLNDVEIPWWRRGMVYFNAGDWGRANDVSLIFQTFTDSLHCIASDAVVECIVAACGVATAGQNYDIAEEHSWFERQSFWNRNLSDAVVVDYDIPRSNWSSNEKGYGVSDQYPSGHIVVGWNGIELRHDYDNLDKEEIRRLLMTGDEQSMRDFSKSMHAIADDLETMAGKVRSHANNVSYHWEGDAAEKAQRALKAIHDTVLPLAEVYDTIGSLARTCSDDIVAPAKARFDHAVADENWFTDIFQDDDDTSARNYLKSVDKQLCDNVLPLFPQSAQLDLPGLIRPEDRLRVRQVGW
ncbi:WXG100 family type VII secretion target [Nonomuraea jabiensis]|uniref:WXG100 family type VII secretion target n=1 Tax=Nonomuraea jabiensis TaxID=882448 RepID=UPI003D7537EB